MGNNMKKLLFLLLTIGTIGIACQLYAEDATQKEIPKETQTQLDDKEFQF